MKGLVCGQERILFRVRPAELVDALDAHKDAIRFYIGHELARLQHRHLSWRPLLFPASLLPLLGAAYARACERTADRYGVDCCRNPNDAAFALVVLAAGPRLPGSCRGGDLEARYRPPRCR